MTTNTKALEVLREEIMAGLACFCACEPDFDMSYGMRAVAADHILGRSEFFNAVETVSTQDTDLARMREALEKCANAPFSGWTIAQALARQALAERGRG